MTRGNEDTVKDLLELVGPPLVRNTKAAFKTAEVPRSWPKLMFPKMAFGLEFEIENIRALSAAITSLWQTKADNSLRNHGVELTICASGEELTKALSVLANELPDDASFSERTSTHVHVNILNMTVSQLYAFVLLGILLEDFLYRFTIAERKADVYCVPLKYTNLPDSMVWVRTLIRNHTETNKYTQREEIAQLVACWHKYMGINLTRVRDIGTVEFRHLHGTRNMKEVIKWLNVLGKMKVYAMKHSLEEIEQEICMLNTSSEYMPFLEKVFGHKLLKNFDLTHFEKVIEEGVIGVKLCTNPFKYNSLRISNASSLQDRFGLEVMPNGKVPAKNEMLMAQQYAVGVVEDELQRNMPPRYQRPVPGDAFEELQLDLPEDDDYNDPDDGEREEN